MGGGLRSSYGLPTPPTHPQWCNPGVGHFYVTTLGHFSVAISISRSGE